MSITSHNLYLFFFHTPPISPFGLNKEEGRGIKSICWCLHFICQNNILPPLLPSHPSTLQ
jgi:hypothetical protein